MSVQCMKCGLPIRLTENQAENLNCRAIHFLEEDGKLIKIQNRGLRVGTRTIMEHVEYGIMVSVGNNCDLYGCRIGNYTHVGHNVVIEGDVMIGQRCKIKAGAFIPEGTRIGRNVFIGPHVVICNDKNPRSSGSWNRAPVIIEDDVSIGAAAVILPGLRLQQGCIVGAGSVVTRDVGPGITVIGNPARELS